MKIVSRTAALALVAAALVVAPSPLAGRQAPPAGAAPDPVAALKQSMTQGLALIRQYEWIETTIISLKGEEKARTQKRCYYGADGKVQKVAMDQPQPEKADSGRGGRRGGGRVKQQVVENKKGEMQDYMERASALIHRYVPPDPAQIQAAKDGNRIAKTAAPGGAVHLAISQYLLAGDTLAIDLDPAAGRITTLAVNTYLDKPEDVVTLAVDMKALPDGALYAAQTTLEAKAKNITVVIQNGGHRPAAR